MSWMNHQQSPDAAKLKQARALYQESANGIQNAVTCWFIAVGIGILGLIVTFAQFSDVDPADSRKWGTWILIGAGVLVFTGIITNAASKKKFNQAVALAEKAGYTIDDLTKLH